MSGKPLDLTLELEPRARFDVVELRSTFADEHEALSPYPHCLYWSSHTTAGFLDRSLAARLSPERIPTYVDAFRRLFPEGAGYNHDQMERRDDLDPAQRAVEPKNADLLGVAAVPFSRSDLMCFNMVVIICLRALHSPYPLYPLTRREIRIL